jgi:hypothetical protein
MIIEKYKVCVFGVAGKKDEPLHCEVETFNTEPDAIEWISEEGIPGIMYHIIKTYTRK